MLDSWIKFASRRNPRESGNTILAVLFIMIILASFVMTQTLFLQKNLQQSNFYASKSTLRHYATSAVNLALQDLNLNISGDDGKIGTTAWTAANDYGRDGTAATNDEGEGDGLPTAGEPNVAPVDVGPAGDGITMIAYSEDTEWNNVKRIVGKAYKDEAETSVELFCESSSSLPGGATYLKKGVTIHQYDGSGSTGIDTNPNGTLGTAPTTWGIATDPAVVAGANAAALKAQIPAAQWPKITGTGPTPSIGEATEALDFDALFTMFQSQKTLTYPGGPAVAVQNKPSGTALVPQITYFSGKKWTYSGGPNFGYGVLVLDVDEFVMSGDSYFCGLIILRAKTKITLSGGPKPHIYGQFIIAPKPGFVPELTQSGSGKVIFNSVNLQFAQSHMVGGGGEYEVLHWNTW